MAQIDMNKINTNTDNSTEIKESEALKQVDTNTETTESTDNALETTEDNSETAKDEAKEENKAESNGKVVVRYVGSGIWKDAKGELWASTNKSNNIVSERQYTYEEYENREDIKFMVGYGAMNSTHVK